ncbi:hypothetical protein [Vibrio casei]|uniref:hypothetical protein n=1 Tax=Vibrio casei TaxID=673372 RepID=UPI003F9B6967
MKFKSFVGKKVYANKKIVEFKKEEYETTNEAEIKALESAKNVTKVTATAKK